MKILHVFLMCAVSDSWSPKADLRKWVSSTFSTNVFLFLSRFISNFPQQTFCSSLSFPIQIMFFCPFINQTLEFLEKFPLLFLFTYLEGGNTDKNIMWKVHETSNIGHKRNRKKLCKYLLRLENMVKLKIAVRGQKSNNRVKKKRDGKFC